MVVRVRNTFLEFCTEKDLADALTRASAKQSLSELLRVSQRLSLALVVRHSLSKGKTARGNRVARIGI